MTLRVSTWHRHEVHVRDDMGLLHPCRDPLWNQVYHLIAERVVDWWTALRAPAQEGT